MQKHGINLAKIQQQIQTSNLGQQGILELLAQTVHHLTFQRGLAVILFDKETDCAQIHFNDGLVADNLTVLCKTLTAAKIHGLPIKFEMLAYSDFVYQYQVPLGTLANPCGVFVMAADPTHTSADSLIAINELIGLITETLNNILCSRLIGFSN